MWVHFTKTLLLIDDKLISHGNTLQNLLEMAELFATIYTNILIPVPNITEELSYYAQDLGSIFLEHEKKRIRISLKFTIQ